jgi:hypothetical protein
MWLLGQVRHTLFVNLTSPHLSFQYIYYAYFFNFPCNVFLTSESKTYNYEVSITCTHTSILTYLYIHNFKCHTPISYPPELFVYFSFLYKNTKKIEIKNSKIFLEHKEIGF